MRWYLAARRWWLTVVVAVLVVVTAGVLASATVGVPRALSGVDFPLPLSVLAPCLVAWLAQWNMTRGEPDQEAIAVRTPPAYDLALLGVVVFSQIVAAVITMAWVPSAESLMVVRNTMGYIAVGVLVARVVGPVLANLAVMLVPLGCAAFGATVTAAGDREYAWWAWPLHDGSGWTAWVFVAGLGVVASASMLTRRRPGQLRASRIRLLIE
ncbi:hypothetical protein [Phytoactinopolyspora limicola]|uniref:hypothetical protein n=1 Tax=Phytoactinopolyspora limicola TaxID=2715536 RepID=UPI00140D7904|nr:hypothetical protein [Phytoactinopolyspora limicola]